MEKDKNTPSINNTVDSTLIIIQHRPLTVEELRSRKELLEIFEYRQSKKNGTLMSGQRDSVNGLVC